MRIQRNLTIPEGRNSRKPPRELLEALQTSGTKAAFLPLYLWWTPTAFWSPELWSVHLYLFLFLCCVCPCIFSSCMCLSLRVWLFFSLNVWLCVWVCVFPVLCLRDYLSPFLYLCASLCLCLCLSLAVPSLTASFDRLVSFSLCLCVQMTKRGCFHPTFTFSSSLA